MFGGNTLINLSKYYKKESNKNINSTITKLVMALGMAAVTGLFAQIVIPLPWTPVPISLQTFAVLLSGIILGKKYGGLSQIFYIALGVMGIPWFAGMTSGLDILIGSDLGYFLGFVLTAFVIGHFSEKYDKSLNIIQTFFLIGITSLICMYVPGLIGLNIFLSQTTGIQPSLIDLMIMGFIPFIFGDILKISCASVFYKVIK